MSEKVTTKSTKNAIWEAYQAAMKQLEAKNALVEDPTAKIQESAHKQALADAEAIVSMNILNPEITEQYKNLQDAIRLHKKELEDIYGIQTKAESLTAIINAYNVKKAELDDKYKADVAAYEAELEQRKEDGNATLEELQISKERKIQELQDAYAEKRDALEKERKREAEEYDYALRRERQKENDAWNDMKAERQAALAAKEHEVSKLQVMLDEKVDYMAELEAKVAEIPVVIEQAKSEAFEDGKKKAGQEYAFEKHAIEQKNAYEMKAEQGAKKRAEEALELERQKNIELQEKLDAAYAQMRDLASETVKSNGGVRILQSDTSK